MSNDTEANKVSLSECTIWQSQKDYYLGEGIKAWSAGKVPFYITSNPYIANSYANIIIRFIQDWVKRSDYQPQEPFNIIELGAGTGTFSFYILKRLVELQQALELENVGIVYVMTDMVQANIDYWQTHSALQSYIERGILDFAKFDLQSEQEIALLRSNKILAPAGTTATNPFIILANYVFDSLPQDIFKVTEGKLQEGVLNKSIQLPECGNNYCVMLEELNQGFAYQEAALPYYNNVCLDTILTNYQKQMDEGGFLLPIASLVGIDRLLAIAKHKLVLISTDKGYTRCSKLHQHNNSALVFHDKCFSMSVNFDAIGQYFKQCDGDYYHQFLTQSIVTSVFTAGIHFKELRETQQAAITYLDSFSHARIFNLYSHIAETRANCSLETIIAYLGTTQWDPQMFSLCFNVILQQLKNLPVAIKQDLIDIMPKIAANFYYLPSVFDIFMSIGIIFQELGEYRTALIYYYRSLDCYGRVDGTLYNMGLCYYFLQEYDNAAVTLRSVLEITPNYVMARGWLAQIEFEQSQQLSNSINSS